MKNVEVCKQLIGKHFDVKGFEDLRTLQIATWYWLGKYLTLECTIIKSIDKNKIGQRENLLYRDIVKNNKLVKQVNVLSR